MSEPANGVLLRRYVFKLYPNRAQAERLEELRRLHCQLYNACLQQRIEAYQRCGVTLTYFDQSTRNKRHDGRALDDGLRYLTILAWRYRKQMPARLAAPKIAEYERRQQQQELDQTG